jgi:hypothetical protein
MNHDQGTTFTDPGANANDAFEGNVSARITVSGSVNPNVAGSYTLTYRVSDTAGNASAPITRTVVVADLTRPVITRLGNATINLLVGNGYSDAGATASDTLDGDLTAAIVTVNPVNTSVAGTYTIRYNVSDSAGNAATEVTRRVVVSADTTRPVITLQGSATMTLVIGTLFTDPGATATDNIDGNITARITRTGSVNVNTAGTYILTYRVSDNAGNAATPVNRTVSVVAPSRIDIEAETARIVGGPVVNSSASGFTGSGYIRTSNSATRVGDYFEFTSVSALAVPYDLSIRYSNGRSGSLEVRLNGVRVGTINMGWTGSYSIWRRSGTIRITPRQGTNTLRFVVLDREGHIDSVRLQPR